LSFASLAILPAAEDERLEESDTLSDLVISGRGSTFTAALPAV